jgi:regulatory protein YycH of two-component signal transduction system YycFG
MADKRALTRTSSNPDTQILHTNSHSTKISTSNYATHRLESPEVSKEIRETDNISKTMRGRHDEWSKCVAKTMEK